NACALDTCKAALDHARIGVAAATARAAPPGLVTVISMGWCTTTGAAQRAPAVQHSSGYDTLALEGGLVCGIAHEKTIPWRVAFRVATGVTGQAATHASKRVRGCSRSR